MNDSFIIIGQYEGRSIISALIKWRTWSNISHTAIISRDEEWVYEAWHKGGVIKSPWNNQPHTPGTPVTFYKIQCPLDVADAFYTEVENVTSKGIKYDFKAIIGFILRKTMQDSELKFCSEMATELLNNHGLYPVVRIEPYKVSPGLLNVSPLLEFYKKVRTP